MNKLICRRCFVSGQVQGVGFRYYTRQEAKRLNLSGWAHNLTDGRVEVLVYGVHSAVEQLCTWLHKGPSLAQVTSVECENINPVESITEFKII
jgi:acylphosphatase